MVRPIVRWVALAFAAVVAVVLGIASSRGPEGELQVVLRLRENVLFVTNASEADWTGCMVSAHGAEVGGPLVLAAGETGWLPSRDPVSRVTVSCSTPAGEQHWSGRLEPCIAVDWRVRCSES